MSEAVVVSDALKAAADVALRTAAMAADLEPLIAAMRCALKAGNRLLFAGNGGSAADAQHVAAEYVVRLGPEQRRALPAIALTTDTSILTAAANDLGFENLFARQLEALARPGDVLVMHSTSGNSPNLLMAASRARELGVTTGALLGKRGGLLAALVDHPFVVPDDRVSHIQETQMMIQHAIAAILVKEFAG
jgi:D-sedoheptulose 7-phosphate isomerase